MYPPGFGDPFSDAVRQLRIESHEALSAEAMGATNCQDDPEFDVHRYHADPPILACMHAEQTMSMDFTFRSLRRIISTWQQYPS